MRSWKNTSGFGSIGRSWEKKRDEKGSGVFLSSFGGEGLEDWGRLELMKIIFRERILSIWTVQGKFYVGGRTQRLFFFFFFWGGSFVAGQAGMYHLERRMNHLSSLVRKLRQMSCLVLCQRPQKLTSGPQKL